VNKTRNQSTHLRPSSWADTTTCCCSSAATWLLLLLLRLRLLLLLLRAAGVYTRLHLKVLLP
jgi:hypothetical protein